MSVSEDDFLLGKDKLINLKLTVPLSYLEAGIFFRNLKVNLSKIQSNLSVRTPLYYGQFPISRQNSHIFYFKKTSTIWTLTNTDNGH